jgi:SAM-dependent methyltransferase
LPFPADTFQLVTVAFGLRNVTDTDRGIAEMVRVARPGGRVAILEFSQPRHWLLGRLYRAYFRWVLAVGAALSRLFPLDAAAGGAAGFAQPRSCVQLPAGQRDGVSRRRSARGETARPRAGGSAVLSADVWGCDALCRYEASCFGIGSASTMNPRSKYPGD